MACHIAENPPLSQLRNDLGIPIQCHSFRRHCEMGLDSKRENGALGVPGAAIGYCQALFGRAGVAAEHTRNVLRLLQEIDAPWARSHEMFWSYRQVEPTSEFLYGGMSPLIGGGRIPVLITGLDPGTDRATIDEIFSSAPPICAGETVLVRMTVQSPSGPEAAAELIRTLVDRARAQKQMPTWWPLLQSTSSTAPMLRLKARLGDLWQYANVAVNPFTPADVYDCVRDQVTVGQVVVGPAERIESDGAIGLAEGMTISGAAPMARYSLPEYFEQLSELETPPTLIILGPSLPHWTDAMNQARIAALIPHLQTACDRLWHRLDPNRRKAVWRMSA